MISELRSDKSDWPWFVKLVEHAINHRPQLRLVGHAPVTAMTGLPAVVPNRRKTKKEIDRRRDKRAMREGINSDSFIQQLLVCVKRG